MKTVLILKGSPRKSGNSALLADEFARGAADAGHKVETVSLREKEIGDCLGCAACQDNGGQCVQNDDMTALCERMLEADVIAFASPVWFYTWPSIMKRFIDRTFAVEKRLQNKTFYLLGAGAARDERGMRIMIDCYRNYIGCFTGEGNGDGGCLFACNTRKPGEARGTEAFQKAYQLGKTIR